MYQWKKLGLIFEPKQRFDWMQTHATTPVPIHLHSDVYRIFFSTRNALQQNQIGFVDIDIEHPTKVLNMSEQPVLGLGKLGYFDCDGVYATCIVKEAEKLYCYYGGWNAGQRGLFYSNIGLAVSDDGGLHFRRISPAPIVGRDEIDPWSTMAPFVMHDDHHGWRMWYASGIAFNHSRDSRYNIKYAESADGIRWEKKNLVSFALGERDSNIARACVYKEAGVYRAWYPFVSKEAGVYRIGYGESKDGVIFDRMDEKAGISVSDQGWDSKAVTYPYVFKHKDVCYMLYNGNDFGKEGFGLAVCL